MFSFTSCGIPKFIIINIKIKIKFFKKVPNPVSFMVISINGFFLVKS